MINGVIFQKKDDKKYQGVDGDNWYLNDNFNEEWLDELDEKVEKAWYDDDWVDVCADNIFIKKYINYSEKEHRQPSWTCCFRPLLLEHIWELPNRRYCQRQKTMV